MPRSRVSEISQTPRDPSKRKHKKQLLITGLPGDSHAQFKGACGRLGYTMRDIVIRFMWAFAQATPTDIERDMESMAKNIATTLKHQKAVKLARRL